MKRILCLLLLTVLLVAVAASCTETPAVSEDSSEAASSSEENTSSKEAEASKDKSKEESKEESAAVSEDPEESENLEGKVVITNLDYNNTGKMGDNDGPAYCVYSKEGYNKASMDVLISQIKINTKRRDRKYLNAYMFLGCDITNNGYWCNCFDVGFCWSGSSPVWHLFYNIYEGSAEKQKTWYESNRGLPATHDYRLILDTSAKDESATIIVYDLTADRQVDTATFGVKNLRCDGSNTSYLMDFALDYPGDVKKDTDGKPSEDWKQITLYNTDQNLYMKNILVENVKIWKGEEEFVWTEEHTNNRSLWPEKKMKEIDYVCTRVIAEEGTYDYQYRVDFDMNRR